MAFPPLRDLLLPPADQSYIEEWAAEANSWQNQLGVYDTASQMLPEVEGRVHVDLACGAGHLLQAIRRNHPGSTRFGVEIVQGMARKGVELAQRAGDPALLIDDPTSTLPELGELEPSTLIIVDDVRSMRIIQQILGDAKIDSGSLTLTGLPPSILKASTGRTTMKPETISRKAAEARDKQAYKFFTTRIRPGGTLIKIDRFAIDLPPDFDDDLVDTLKASVHASTMDRLGSLARFWKIEEDKTTIHTPNETQRVTTGLAWSPTFSKMTKQERARLMNKGVSPDWPATSTPTMNRRSVNLAIIALTRNDAQFPPKDSRKRRRRKRR